MPIQTIKDFAKSHGSTEWTLRMWIRRHGFPVVKIGGRIYIDEDDYISWVAAHKIVMVEEKTKTYEIALPKSCRKSSVAMKMQRIY